MTIVQPRVMEATSSADMGLEGSNPLSCYSGLIYIIIYAPFRLQDQWIHIFSHSQIGGWIYAPLYLIPGSVPHLPHADSHHSYRPALPHILIDYQSHSLMLLRPISSSSAELYFLSLIIISPVSIPAHVLEPLNFDLTHSSWPLMLETSINVWIHS